MMEGSSDAESETAPEASEGDINLTPGREVYLQRAISASTRRWLEADARVYMRQSLSTPCMNVLRGASGSCLIDAQGRELLDFHGNCVHQVGHAHPRVVEAVKRQLDELAFCPRRFTNDPAVRLGERLVSLTQGRLSKVLLTPGGAGAVGLAMKLARLATGRHKTISMWGSFHGASLDGISIGGEALFREGMGPLLPGCLHVDPWSPQSCERECGAKCAGRCAGRIEEALSREGDVGAVIAEPVRCTTVDIPSPAYWQRVRAACDRHGSLLVFDEVPTCLGRTGRMFAFEHFNVIPDVLVIGKGLGGGVFPQAAILARAELDVGARTALGHYTHEKSPVGCAAALATLDVIEDEGLVERSAELGDMWRKLLGQRVGPLGCVLEVRGLGLLTALEVKVAGSKFATAAFADHILYACMERGLSFKVSDGRVLTLTPPLTVSRTELDRAASILEDVLRQVVETSASR